MYLRLHVTTPIAVREPRSNFLCVCLQSHVKHQENQTWLRGTCLLYLGRKLNLRLEHLAVRTHYILNSSPKKEHSILVIDILSSISRSSSSLNPLLQGSGALRVSRCRRPSFLPWQRRVADPLAARAAPALPPPSRSPTGGWRAVARALCL